MPMNMGIHHKPIGCGCLAFLDSRLRGNDGGMFLRRKRLGRETCLLSSWSGEAETGFLLSGARGLLLRWRRNPISWKVGRWAIAQPGAKSSGISSTD